MAIFTLEVAADGIAELRFDTPDARVNTFGRQALQELGERLGEIEEAVRGGRVKGVVFTSAKPDNFIAGADINVIGQLDSEEQAREAGTYGQDLFDRVQDLPVPTLAAINGSCVGGGLELALACDYRSAADSPKTQIGLPETQLGIIPGWGGTFRLPRIAGWEQATKMILAGSTVDADRALRYGIVDAVYPAAFFGEWTRKLFADLVAGKPAVARARSKATKRRRWLVERTGIGKALLFRTAKKQTLARVGTHYPAPLAALRVLAKTKRGKLRSRAARRRAMRVENRAFGALAYSPVCKNLTQIFFAREAAKKQAVLTDAAADYRVDQAAVLGAGVMGGRIAWLLAGRHVNVVMKDINWDAVAGGYQSASQAFARQQKRRKIDARQFNLGMNRIHGAVDYRSIGAPSLTIEAVVERIEVKQAVLAELEPLLSDDAIIASNTSALSIDQMAAALRRPERFVGMHFFNPVDRMPLVEVVQGAKTAPEVVGNITKLALRLGKTPVVVKDSPGFLVNRILLPYLNEAAVMLADKVDVVTVDRQYTDFGLPMGPYTLLDEVGIDVGSHVAKTLHSAFGDRVATAPFLDALTDRKDLLGKKGGAGFYLYQRGRKRATNPAMSALIAAQRPAGASTPSRSDILDRGLLSMVNEAARTLSEGVVGSAQELDLAMIMGTGFPPFRGGLLRWADSVGIAQVVARLRELAERYGKRFDPAPLLVELADRNGVFYSA